MEDLIRFKEAFKEMAKQRLRTGISSSWEKHWDEIQKTIETATDSIASKVMDEAKIEEIAKVAQAGAAYVAVSETIKKVAKDAVEEAKPIIEQFLNSIGALIEIALSEAIQELIWERLNQSKV